MPPSSGRLLDERIDALRRALAHTGPMVSEPVSIPGTDTVVVVSRPTDTNLLLDQIASDPEQNLPYWSEIWPSGIALAADIARHPDRVLSRRVLELGCGAGITAAVAVAHGARLTATDYAPESLLLTRMTCLVHTGHEPDRVTRVNWRATEISGLVRDGGYDVVLGADLLYERRDIEPLIAATETLVAPGGALWLAEPGREPARLFLRALETRGWTAVSSTWSGPWPDPKDAGVVARTHWLRRNLGPGLDTPGGSVQ